MRAPLFSVLAAMVVSVTAPRSLAAGQTGRAEASSESTSSTDKDKARTLALRGFERLQNGEPERAISLFREAEKLYHAPTIVLLLAQAHERLDRVVEARALYRSIIDEDLPRAAPREYLEAKLSAKQAFEALAGRFATLEVIVPGATAGDVTLIIDGEPAGGTGAPIPQNPGSHRVMVRGRLGGSVTQVVTLKAGDAERLLVPKDSLDPFGSSGYMAPVITTFTVGMIGLSVGAVTAGLSAAKASDAALSCGSTSCRSSRDIQDANTLSVVSQISFAVGGASLATSAILLYMGRRSGGSSGSGAPSGSGGSNESSAMTLSASPAGLAISGRF